MEKSLSDYLHVLSSRFYLSDTLKFHSTHVGLTLESRYMTWKDVEMKKYKREEEKRRAAGAFPIQRTWKSSRLALQVERRKRERGKKKGCGCFLFFNANTMSNPLDISALTAAAVAELHKQQVSQGKKKGLSVLSF